MIVTLTANPSIDRTVTIAGRLERGGVHRAETMTIQAGGKGVNISRAAVLAGVPTVAVVPARPDDPFLGELTESGIRYHREGPAGDLRVNLAVTEPDGVTTKVNTRGAPASPALLEALAAAIGSYAEDAPWVVLAGSLPDGAPTDWYARLVTDLRPVRARIAVDSSDAPLRSLVDALPAAAPDLMKPNGAELASLTGADPELLESDPQAAAKAAQRLVDAGVGTVLVTLGGAGALLVTADGAWHATPPPVTVASTVGAGDSSLFGYLLGDLRDVAAPERLALAVAYGTAAAGLPGTGIPDPTQTRPDLVTVTELAT